MDLIDEFVTRNIEDRLIVSSIHSLLASTFGQGLGSGKVAVTIKVILLLECRENPETQVTTELLRIAPVLSRLYQYRYRDPLLNITITAPPIVDIEFSNGDQKPFRMNYDTKEIIPTDATTYHQQVVFSRYLEPYTHESISLRRLSEKQKIDFEETLTRHLRAKKNSMIFLDIDDMLIHPNTLGDPEQKIFNINVVTDILAICQKPSLSLGNIFFGLLTARDRPAEGEETHPDVVFCQEQLLKLGIETKTNTYYTRAIHNRNLRNPISPKQEVGYPYYTKGQFCSETFETDTYKFILVDNNACEVESMNARGHTGVHIAESLNSLLSGSYYINKNKNRLDTTREETESQTTTPASPNSPTL